MNGFSCVAATERSMRCEEAAIVPGCLAAWFRHALDGSDASDLLGEHPESFRIVLHQHSLNEERSICICSAGKDCWRMSVTII